MYLSRGAMLGGKDRHARPLKVLPSVQESEINVFKGWEAHPPTPKRPSGCRWCVSHKPRWGCETRAVSEGDRSKISVQREWRMASQVREHKSKCGHLSRGLLHGGCNFQPPAFSSCRIYGCLATVGFCKPPSPKCISAERLCGDQFLE